MKRCGGLKVNIKFKLIILVLVIIFLSFFTNHVLARDGQVDPIILSSESDLINMMKYISEGNSTVGKYYLLKKDIICKESLVPSSFEFAGTFDGNGYMIINLTIDGDKDNTGLFHSISALGSVKNLSINGDISGIETVGSICGINNGSIERCINYANISGVKNSGGIAGINNGLIKESANKGRVVSVNSSGGICGSSSGTVFSCYNLGEVTGGSSGGICGTLRDGWIMSCYNMGKIIGTKLYAGGTVGIRYRNHTLINCYNAGDLTTRNSNTEAGAITALGYYHNCYYNKEIPSLNKIHNKTAITPEEKYAGVNQYTMSSKKFVSTLNNRPTRTSINPIPFNQFFEFIKEWDLNQFLYDRYESNQGYPILYWQRKSFSDIGGHWAEKSIMAVTEKSIMDGTVPNKFEPDKFMTRAEFTKVVANFLNLKITISEKETFYDVPKDNEYYSYIETMAKHEIVSGIGDNLFNPSEGITREELISILVRAINYSDYDIKITEKEAKSLIDKFLDANTIHNWAQKEIGWSIKAGLYDNNNSYLYGNKVVNHEDMTRGQVANIIANSLDYIRY